MRTRCELPLAMLRARFKQFDLQALESFRQHLATSWIVVRHIREYVRVTFAIVHLPRLPVHALKNSTRLQPPDVFRPRFTEHVLTS